MVLLTVIAIYVCAAVFGYAQGYLLNGIVQRTVYRLREDSEAKLNRLPLSYFDGQQRGCATSGCPAQHAVAHGTGHIPRLRVTELPGPAAAAGFPGGAGSTQVPLTTPATQHADNLGQGLRTEPAHRLG